MSSHNSSQSTMSRDNHIQDLHNLLEGMTPSESSPSTITWRRKTVDESITLSRSHFHTHPNHGPDTSQTGSVVSLPSHSPVSSPVQPPPILGTSAPASQLRSNSIGAPTPGDIQASHPGVDAEGFWVIIVGQEVGIFYNWADVAERTNFISGNIQKWYPSFEKALAAYTIKYNEGSVRAVPIPGGPFSPSVPSPTLSATSDDLWSQVEDLSDTMSRCGI